MGHEIHGGRSQDIRKFNINRSSLMILVAILILSALVGIVIIRSKEAVVLGMMGVVVLILVVVSIMYTLMYASKLSVVGKVGESEGFYVLVVMFLSILLVEVNFRV